MKKLILKYLLLFTIMITGCSADLKTKEIAKTALKDSPSVVIENVFDLRYVENHAIAFGFLREIKKSIRIPLVFFLTVSATLMVFAMIWKIRNNKFRILLPLFIILSGAYGNILDRFFNGFVTDFFHVHYFYKHNFPVFNVADVLINIGLILIVLQWKDFKLIIDNLSARQDEVLVEG